MYNNDIYHIRSGVGYPLHCGCLMSSSNKKVTRYCLTALSSMSVPCLPQIPYGEKEILYYHHSSFHKSLIIPIDNYELIFFPLQSPERTEQSTADQKALQRQNFHK